MLCLQLFAFNIFAQAKLTNTVIKNDVSVTLNGDSIHFHSNIISDYFIVGTMNYCRSWEKLYKDDSVIDHYYPAASTRFMKRYIKACYNITVSEDSLHGFLYSKELITRLSGILDTNRCVRNYDSLTEPQLLSYLLGVYYSNGYKLTDSIFSIMPYRLDEHALFNFLRQAGCNKVYTRYQRGCVPDLTDFYFKASPQLCMYFKMLEEEKTELEFSKLNRPLLNEEFRQDILKGRIEMARKLKAVFDD
jgi:hypothetical protein